MEQKRVVLFLMFLVVGILFSSLISAAEITQSSEVDRAYSCLISTIGSNCSTRNVQLNAFNLLAISYDESLQEKCKASLISKKNTNNCWPSTEGGSCEVKPTALSIIALLKIDVDVEKEINWTLSKQKLENSLTWFLEIDTANYSKCDINGQPIILGEDKKIISGSPDGLERTYNNYWFKIKKIEKNYTISCDKAFTTTLMYQKPSNSAYYVSSNPHSASAGDDTVEKVESYCFGTGSVCEYESSIWATLALLKYGKDISPYMPYLSAMSDDPKNQDYLPSAFLLMITGMSEYEEELKSLQKEGRYWGEGALSLEQTPLAVAALISGNAGGSLEVSEAQKYIIGKQDKATGCWQEDKTSYILYLMWPKSPTTVTPPGTNITTPMTCEERSYSCVPSTRCELANQASGYECSGFAEICCKSPMAEASCKEQGGEACDSTEECSGEVVTTDDEPNCCLQSCILREEPLPQCPTTGDFLCKSKCSTEETPSSIYACSGNMQCCSKIITTTGKNNLWLIILLIILIILVILAIILRNQLQIWWFRIKNGFSSKKGPPPTTRFSPSPPFRPVPPRQLVQRPQNPRMYGRMPISRPSEKDKEFEETMKRLKDISK
ncbi:hypothetical protein J4218_01530 [Candidatus Pacearchaeota archaeon]|nr:hypothetical protein [Candidatus Pacearchaeota archaeon]